MVKISWGQIKQKLREDILALPHFFKNPVQGMRALPHWEWPTILLLQTALAASCSILANLIERDFFGVIIGLFLAPLTNILMVAIGAGFFYYVFMFLFHRTAAFRQIYIHVLFASIPMVLLSTVAFYLPPLVLLGSVATLLLLFVGFVDAFQIPMKPLRNLLMGLMAIHVIYWGISQVHTVKKHKALHEKATPESLDILEKELNQDQ